MSVAAGDIAFPPRTAPHRSPLNLRLLARIERTYATCRSLSLDVALAGLAGGVMAARVLHASPRPAFYVLLPAGVWVAYTLDHLLDARRVGAAAHTPRHRLHHRHARVLWTLSVAIAAVALLLAYTGLSRTGLLFGVALATLCGLHEALVKLAGSRASPLLIKELGVAVIFTGGTWGLPLMLRFTQPLLRVQPGAAEFILLTQYLLLALVNLLEFSTYEAAADARDGHTSFVLAVGPAAARRTTAVLLLLQIPLAAAALFLAAARSIRPESIFAAMSAMLAVVLLHPAALRKGERYRTIGDGAFLLPLLMLIR